MFSKTNAFKKRKIFKFNSLKFKIQTFQKLSYVQYMAYFPTQKLALITTTPHFAYDL